MQVKDIKAIIKAFKLFDYDFCALLKFIKLNFFQKNIKRTEGYIYIYIHM